MTDHFQPGFQNRMFAGPDILPGGGLPHGGMPLPPGGPPMNPPMGGPPMGGPPMGGPSMNPSMGGPLMNPSMGGFAPGAAPIIGGGTKSGLPSTKLMIIVGLVVVAAVVCVFVYFKFIRKKTDPDIESGLRTVHHRKPLQSIGGRANEDSPPTAKPNAEVNAHESPPEVVPPSGRREGLGPPTDISPPPAASVASYVTGKPGPKRATFADAIDTPTEPNVEELGNRLQASRPQSVSQHAPQSPSTAGSANRLLAGFDSR